LGPVEFNIIIIFLKIMLRMEIVPPGSIRKQEKKMDRKSDVT